MSRTKKPSELGKLINLARELKGWSVRDLAARAKVSHSAVNQIETGHIREPSFRAIVKISNALGVSLKRLAEAE